MPSSWALVLVVLGGACALPAPAPLAYTQALAQAVESYNQRPEVQNSFRLLSADPEPAPGVDLTMLRVLNFSMMETECSPSSRVNPEDCDFKENGGSGLWGPHCVVLGGVRGAVSEVRGPQVGCRVWSIPMTTLSLRQPVLVQRGRFGRFLGKIRRFRPKIRISGRADLTIRVG
uniref:Uncharacterized protein n=1 Tax=Melopsittacus undulatus TaxID=13146 RepID=A0A8C6IV20_MELUD